MEKRDYKRDAWQTHVAFHDLYLNKLPEEISSGLHSMFDTLILWIEKMDERIAHLEGQLEEARRVHPSFAMPMPKGEIPPFQKAPKTG